MTNNENGWIVLTRNKRTNKTEWIPHKKTHNIVSRNMNNSEDLNVDKPVVGLLLFKNKQVTMADNFNRHYVQEWEMYEEYSIPYQEEKRFKEYLECYAIQYELTFNEITDREYENFEYED